MEPQRQKGATTAKIFNRKVFALGRPWNLKRLAVWSKDNLFGSKTSCSIASLELVTINRGLLMTLFGDW